MFMFNTKKKKIQKYLSNKQNISTAFDLLLTDYLSGALKTNLMSLGIIKYEIHIDWLKNIKCINIQGKYNNYYINIQIDINEFSIAHDLDEADDDYIYPLESKEFFYNKLTELINYINNNKNITN